MVSKKTDSIPYFYTHTINLCGNNSLRTSKLSLETSKSKNSDIDSINFSKNRGTYTDKKDQNQYTRVQISREYGSGSFSSSSRINIHTPGHRIGGEYQEKPRRKTLRSNSWLRKNPEGIRRYFLSSSTPE